MARKSTTIKSTTIYTRRLRSAQSSNVCKCKVGACHICNSRCRRCMCSCDGIDPSDALKRSRGGYRKQVNLLLAQQKKSTTTNKKNDTSNVKTRSMKSNSNDNSTKKRKKNSHFKKVGLLKSARKKAAHQQRKKKKQKCDSDSSFRSTDMIDASVADDDSTFAQPSTVSNNNKESGPLPPPEFDLQIEDGTTNLSDDVSDVFFDANMDLSVEDHNNHNSKPSIADIVKNKRKETQLAQVVVPTNIKSTRNTSTRAEKLENFLSHFEIPKYWLRVIPSFLVRENESDIQSSASKKAFGRMTSLCTKLVDSAIKRICPGPGFPKFRKYLLNKMTKGFDTIKNSPYHRTDQEKLGTVIDILCDWSNKSKKRSIERRVIRSIITESFLTHEIQSFRDDNGLKLGTGQAVQQSRLDAIELKHGRKLKLKVIKRQFRMDSTIEKCVRFILSDENVSSVSWGSKKILLQSSGEMLIPKLTRKCTIRDMYSRYKDLIHNETEGIKSATFYKICNVLTSSDQAMLNSIDYVTCMLVNESCEILQDIIDKVIMNEHREECTKYVTIAKNFMKNQFKTSIMNNDDDCCFHGFIYALTRDIPNRTNTNDNGVKFPFFLCNHLKNMVQTNVSIESDREHVRKDAIQVIDGIAHKFKLFLAHQTRCQCQSFAISQIEENMKELCMRSNGSTIHAMIIIDFKMKYEVKSSRESTVEHYGKRGLGWHGMAIIFYFYDHLENATHKNIVYLDQIMNDSNIQDSGTVIGLLEVGFQAIIKELPFITEAVLVSDNASSYQNHLLTFMIGIYNQKFEDKLFISSIVHSETQYGKTLLDAHFATTNRHLLYFMKNFKENRVTKINSPRGLAWALSFNKGVKNSMIQLVDFDRETLDKIQLILKPATSRCSEYYSRANYIGFKRVSETESRYHGPFNSLGCIKDARLRWKVRAFSNVKPSVQFKVDMSTDELVTVDKKTQLLIMDILERDYASSTMQVNRNSSGKHKNNKKNDKSKGTIDPFDSDSDYDNEPLKLIRNKNTEVEEEAEVDFSFYRYSRKTKKQMVEKLQVVGALDQVGVSKNNEHVQSTSDSEDDDDSDYDEEEDSHINDDDDDDDLDQYFLNSDDYRTYGDPSPDYFPITESITGTSVVKFQPLGAIRKKNSKATKKKQSHISKKYMLKGLVEKATIIANKSILNSDHFKNRYTLDPIVNKAEDYDIEPFKSGWARRNERGRTYGDSYLSLYENELKEMFQMGVEYSYNKMSAGKMREHLQQLHPDCFSIPGETEIKQFINKMSEAQKRIQTVDPGKPKSSRGRKPGNTKFTWHKKLRDILEQDLKDKPRHIYEKFINSYDGKYPSDLPLNKDGDPDDTKIKQALQRFKRNIEAKVQKEVLL